VPQYLGLVKVRLKGSWGEVTRPPADSIRYPIVTAHQEEIKRENDMIDQYVKEQMGLNAPKEQVEEMNEQERRELINALKTKWDAVNAKYQKITHMVKIESFGLLKRCVDLLMPLQVWDGTRLSVSHRSCRKESLEKELKQLETDISLLERHGPVLVRAG
jgi:superfamily II helicase